MPGRIKAKESGKPIIKTIIGLDIVDAILSAFIRQFRKYEIQNPKDKDIILFLFICKFMFSLTNKTIPTTVIAQKEYFESSGYSEQYASNGDDSK